MPNEGDREEKYFVMEIIGTIFILLVIGAVIYATITTIDVSPKEVFYFKYTDYERTMECGEFIHEEHLFKVTIQKKWIVIEDRNRNRITLNIESHVVENERTKYYCVDVDKRHAVIEHDKKKHELKMGTIYGHNYRYFYGDASSEYND